MAGLSDINEKIEFLFSLKLRPVEGYKSSKADWKVECLDCHQQFTIQWASARRGKLKGCKFCKTRVDGVRKKYSESEAFEIFRKFGREPLEDFVNAKKGLKSKCMKCGLIGNPSLSNILVSQNSRCWRCGNDNRGLKRRMTQDAAKELFQLKGVEMISEYYPRKKVDIRCLTCGKESTSSMTNIYKVDNACGFCSQRLIDPLEARELMIQSGYIPLVDYPLSSKRWKCIHESCGRIVYPSYETIRRGGGGCTSCAKQGFDSTAPAYLYFIQSHLHNSFKVGIGNDNKRKRTDRLNKHILENWEVLGVWRFDIGLQAQDIEASVFNVLRKKYKFPIHLSKEEMPQGGWTETFSSELISASKVTALIEESILLITLKQ
jgi:hypothetical protein